MGVGDLLEYRQSLQNYAASFPESERASQFEQVASSQLDVVAVIDRWNAFLDRVDAALRELSLAEARSLHSDVYANLSVGRELPGADQVAEVLELLAPVSARDPGRQLRDNLLATSVPTP